MAKSILDIEVRASSNSAKNIQKDIERKTKPQIDLKINDKAYIKALDAINRAQASIKTGQVRLTDISHTVKGDKVKEFTISLKENENELKKYKNILESLDPTSKNYEKVLAETTLNAKDLQKTQSGLNKDMQASKKEFKSFGKTLLENAKQFASWTSATQIVMQLANAVKQLVREFIQLDKVFTNIQMVTNYTNEQMAELKNTYIAMAKQLSTTVDDVGNAADSWLRMGLSVQEANQALEAAIKLAKIAGTQTEQATTMLISTMKGYKLETQDLISIVDKLSAVDMESASSSEDLAEAISRVASVAYSAGVSLDKLIAYAATIKDISQQSAETVGTALNSIFSRMSKVSAGIDVDDFGESLNDVDKVLKRYNISLRDTSGDMRNMEVVLEEIANKWDSLTTAEKNQISTALGGTKQRNAVLTLLNNYDEVLRLTETSLNSTGTAEQKFSIYTESVEAKLNKLKATWQELAETTINSGFVKLLIDIGTGLLNISNTLGGIVPVLSGIIGFVQLIKAFRLADSLTVLSTKAEIFAVKLNMTLGWIGLITMAVTGLIGIIQHINKTAEQTKRKIVEQAQEIQKEVENLKDSFIALNSTMEKTANNEKIEQSWESLYKICHKLGVQVDELNKSYEYFLQLSNKSEIIALEKETKATYGDYEYAKGKIEGTQGIWDKYAGGKLTLDQYIKYLEDSIQKAEETGSQTATYLGSLFGNVITADIMKVREILAGLYEDKDTWLQIISEYETKDLKRQLLMHYGDAINIKKKEIQDILALDTDMAKKEADIMLENTNIFIEELKKKYPELTEYIEQLFNESQKKLKNIINENLVGKFVNIQVSNIKALQEAEEAENEALQKRLTLQEKILAVQEAQEKLAQAQNKRARVYRAGRGFVYEQDFSQVSAAQKELRSAQQSLREYRSSIKYEEEIALLQEASNEWEKLFINDEEFKKFVNGLTVTMEELGGTTEGILNWMTNTIQEFKNRNGINATETTSGSWNYFSGLSNNGLISPSGYNISGSSLGNVNMSSSNLSTGFTPVSYSTSSGNITNINIGSISLPGVTDAQGFADGLVNLSYQVGTSHK